MRTLALLAALLLLALRGQAGPLAKPADRGTEAGDPLPAQALAGTQDPNVTISFGGNLFPGQDVVGPRRTLTCDCRHELCFPWEQRLGTCNIDGRRHLFCCN